MKNIILVGLSAIYLFTTGAYASKINKANLNPNQEAIVRELKNPDSSYFAEDSIDAVVLAGRNPVLDWGTDYEAILDINDKPMICYVVEALAESDYINNIYIVGEEDKLNKIDFSVEKEIKIVNGTGKYLDDFVNGGNASETEKILYSTCDIPLIEKVHIDGFIEDCAEKGEADLYLPYCIEEEDKRKFPEIETRYVLEFPIGGNSRTAYILLLNRYCLDKVNKNKDIKKIIASLDSTREERIKIYEDIVKRNLSLRLLKLYIRYKRGTLIVDEAGEFLSKLTRKNIVLIKSSSEIGTNIKSRKDLENIEEIMIKKSEN